MAKGSRTHSRHRWTLAVGSVCAAAGFVFVASGLSADGSDLRPAGGDVGSLIADRSENIRAQRDTARALQEEIDVLSAGSDDDDSPERQEQLTRLRDVAGMTDVRGPGVRVVLTDAPRSVDVPGLDPNVLVVHQQDLQAFVNAFWAGGAEAITLQGQRLISTVGIKCVGNTVVLDGVPYAPPYVIEAVGDPDALSSALSASPEVGTYEQYAERYDLGLEFEALESVTAEAYSGTIGLTFAAALN